MAASFSGGVKKEGQDMAVLYSSHPAVSAGMCTTNRVRAACVDWNSDRLGNNIRLILANSGNANACTGPRGAQDSHKLASAAAARFQIHTEEVLLASTGVIGVPLPVEKMCSALAALPTLHDTPTALSDAASAIMTTDTVKKIAFFEFHSEGRTVRIAGIAKGSGMIHPNMATMLGFILTDAQIDARLLQDLTRDAVDESFNMISVDGDTSTNDMALVLANGASGVKIDSRDSCNGIDFEKGLQKVCRELAVAIARDGEGATKLLRVDIEGGTSVSEARTLAKSVVSSNLVKAALFGEDANWGRIIAAMGYSGASFDPDKVSISFSSDAGELQVMDKGMPLPFDENSALIILKEKEIRIDISLTAGCAKATAWGCDLTYDYVKINGSYRS